MDLNDIYTEVINENSRSIKNRRKLENATHELRGVNPSCGDDITLELEVKDNQIVDAAFSGVGCAISQASTSIMIDLIRGKSLEEVQKDIGLFIGMIQRKELDDAVLEPLEDAIAFKNVSNMPARVKCAVLPWRTLEKEIDPNSEQ